MSITDAELERMDRCGSCREEASCTPETCPFRYSWRHRAYCVKHICAHDWDSGPVVEFDGGKTRSCACGMTAIAHDMKFAP